MVSLIFWALFKRDVKTDTTLLGFITFSSEDEAQRIQAAQLEVVLHNRKLNIGPAMKRNLPVPVEAPKADALPDYSSFFPFLATSGAPASEQMLHQPVFPYYGFPFNFPYGIPSYAQSTPHNMPAAQNGGALYQYPF